MKASEATVAWTPANAMPGMKGWENAGKVGVGPRPPYSFVDGYWSWCYADQGAGKAPEGSGAYGALAMLFINFNTLVVRDGIDPQVAHEAFLAIDEYRKHIAPDIQGAE